MQNERKWCVYKHTSPSGKVYIGLTSTNPKRRWKNGKGYKQHRYFLSAIEKYGWDNITHEVLFTDLTKEEACNMEIDLIRQYDSTNRLYGYNCSVGGDSGNNGVTSSEESRKKRSVALMGHEVSEETRRKISEKHKGKKKSPEAVEKGRLTKLGTHMGADHHRSKKVLCVETGAIYNGMGEAGRMMGIEPKNISAVCNGRRNIAGGYHWKIIENEVA